MWEVDNPAPAPPTRPPPPPFPPPKAELGLAYPRNGLVAEAEAETRGGTARGLPTAKIVLDE